MGCWCVWLCVVQFNPLIGTVAQQIDYGAFLEYQLRSLRAVDRKLLNMLRQAYISLDQEKNGYFTPAVSHKSVLMMYIIILNIWLGQDLKDFRIRSTSISGNYMAPAQASSGGMHNEMDVNRERGASVMSVPMVSPRETTLARSGSETPTSRF